MAVPTAIEDREITAGDARMFGDVLLVCPEQDLVNVAQPRLIAAKVELSRIHALRGLRRASQTECRLFQLNEDLLLLQEELLRRMKTDNPIRLVVVDPFPVELFDQPRSAARVREVIAHLAEIADEVSAAVLLVAGSDSRGEQARIVDALESAAQSAWTIVPDLDRPERRLLLPVKANWTENATGSAFTLRSGTVCWAEERIELTHEQYLQEQKLRSRDVNWEREWTEFERATEFLRRSLLGRGKVPLRQIKQLSAADNIAFTTLRRAFCALEGTSERTGERQFCWSLVAMPPTTNRTGEQVSSRTGDSGGDAAEKLEGCEQ